MKFNTVTIPCVCKFNKTYFGQANIKQTFSQILMDSIFLLVLFYR